MALDAQHASWTCWQVLVLSCVIIISSFHEWAYAIARRPSSVCLSVCKLCANRYFYHKHDSIATKLAHDGPQMGLHPGCAQGQGQGQGQRSRDTDTFLTTRKSLLLPQTWLDHHQTCTPWCPDGPASRVCSRSRSRSRSKVTWYGHFFDYTKINMTRSPPKLYNMVPTWACIQGVLQVKVMVKSHMIRTLLWCHEMFAIQYLLTFCLCMHSLYEAPLHCPSSISVRQLDVLCSSWNELLRHWRSDLW